MPCDINPPLLSIFCRWPTPGEAKTRLIPGFGADGAAAIYTKLLSHTVMIARASGIPFELRVSGASEHRFKERFGADIPVVQQGGGDLTDRLARVPAPALVIGSDCPGLTVEILQRAGDILSTHPAVIGPARDGGYYLLGYAAPSGFAFTDMEWSVPAVFAQTMQRFAGRGITPVVLPPLSDVDTAADLADWPEFLP